MRISRKLFVLFLLGLCLHFSWPSNGWQPYPNKVDMLAVIAHPDDEGYWGGLLPYYANCQQKRVVLISLTSGEWGNGLPHSVEPGDPPDCSYDDTDYPCFHKIPKAELVFPSYYREQEMAEAASVYGLRYEPIMPRWRDMILQPWGEAAPGFEWWGGKDFVVEYLTAQIRRFKPDVVVGLAWNGGNGNPQHIAAAQGTVLASEAAGDRAQFSAQVKRYGTWQPKKVYLHATEDEVYDVVHEHDWTMPCNNRISETAQILAAEGNARHESQEMAAHSDPNTNFVLKVTTVGVDTVGKNNLFEHIAIRSNPLKG